ncbi:hypothetical protein [Pseudoramibacter faecis]|uniref:hypothetical protein n=1 Tax=Pseudoramibacter faecis TaxID=3108534 RepID=UPI002E79123D|nr:hypothetical protein [Pseudoramibacter sp. HA2172]
MMVCALHTNAGCRHPHAKKQRPKPLRPLFYKTTVHQSDLIKRRTDIEMQLVVMLHRNAVPIKSSDLIVCTPSPIA